MWFWFNVIPDIYIYFLPYVELTVDSSILNHNLSMTVTKP